MRLTGPRARHVVATLLLIALGAALVLYGYRRRLQDPRPVCALHHRHSWELRPSRRIAFRDWRARPGGREIELKVRFDTLPAAGRESGGMVRFGLGLDAADGRYDAAPAPPNAHPPDGLVFRLSQCRFDGRVQLAVEQWGHDKKTGERSTPLNLALDEWHVLLFTIDFNDLTVTEEDQRGGPDRPLARVPLSAPCVAERLLWPKQVYGSADVAWIRTGADGFYGAPGGLGAVEKRNLGPWVEYPPNHGQVTYTDGVLRLGCLPDHGAHAFWRESFLLKPCDIRMRVIAHDAPWGPDGGHPGGMLGLVLAEAGSDREAEMTDQRGSPLPRNGVEIGLYLREPALPRQQSITPWRDGKMAQSAYLGPPLSWHEWHDVVVRIRRQSVGVEVDGESLGRAGFSPTLGIPRRVAFMNVSADIDIADFRIVPVAANPEATP